MAVVKFLNPRTVVSSQEDIVVSLYAHTNFKPEPGLSFTADVYNLSGLLGQITVDETLITGHYTGSLQDQLGDLPADDYVIVVQESGTEIGVVNVSKGPFLAKAEAAAVDNKRYETKFAEASIDYRNIVVDSLERTNVSSKNYEDSSFDSPLVSGSVLYSYKNPTTRSDVLLSSPVIEKPLITAFNEGFESITWIDSSYTEGFEDNSWDTGVFTESFEDSSWS